MLLKHIIRTVKPIFFLSIAITLIFFPISLGPATVQAQTTDELTQKLTQLQNQLNDINNQKKVIQQQIAQEQNNQSDLQSQISLYNNKISDLQLTINGKQTYIESLETQISLTESNINTIKTNISDLEYKIEQLNDIYSQRVKTNFKNSFKTTLDNLLSGDDFETFLIQKEFSSTLAQENQKVVDELSQNKQQLSSQQNDLNNSLKQQEDLQNQVKAETADLGYQQDGLKVQQQQKQNLLAVSQNTSNQLKQQQIQLEQEATKANQEMDLYIAQIAGIHANGTPITRGEIVGKMGRTGYVLAYSQTKGWYYPNPITEPCAGAHTHLEVRDASGSYTRDPLPYIENGTITPPFRTYQITQYYGQGAQFYGGTGHTGIDFVGDNGCGTPVYSGVAGIINYRCYISPYAPTDPTYMAVIFDPVHNINVIYLHLQKIPGLSCGGYR